jgi:prophage regulatory protein
VPLGDRRVAFVASEVRDWIGARIAARATNDTAATQAA